MAKRRKKELPKTEGWKSVAIKNAQWHDAADGNGGTILALPECGVCQTISYGTCGKKILFKFDAGILTHIHLNQTKERSQTFLKLYSHTSDFISARIELTLISIVWEDDRIPSVWFPY